MKTKTLQKSVDRYAIIGLYLFTFLAILFALYMEWHWAVLLPVMLFLAYDLYFRFDIHNKNFRCRGYKGTLDSVRQASTYISYFLAVMGIMIGVLASNTAWSDIADKLEGKYWIKAFALVAIALSGVAMLFIPIRYKDKDGQPTVALKNCFTAVLFFEKVIILFFVYIVLYLSKSFI
jgi:lysylphosphatidylglycerol synthetase-like protein (DUF2156 family)